jgi:microcystin-dependent protein
MTAFIRRQFSGAARNTTTTTLLGVSGTSVDIAATTGWPSVAGIPFYVVINPSSLTEEKCLATISGSTLTLTRAQDDTTASEHPIGSVIYPVFTANDADEANELVSKLTTKGDLLVTDGTNLIRLGVGADGYFLKASSSASVGIEWASIPTINNLNDIGDVSITTAEEGDFLVYKNSASAWINETIHFITVSDTAPTDEIREGDLWYNSLELELYTYFSNSWIQVTETQSGPQELYELIDVLIDDPEYGQTLVYNGTEWENSVIQSALTLENPRVISLSGDVSGSVAFDGSQDVSIATTIQLNGVALGTDTTGSYVQSLVAGTGVTLSNNSGESATPTIEIGQEVGTSASVVFAHVATDSLNVVNNVVGTGNITLSPNISSYVIGDTGPAGGKIFITPSTSGNTTGKYFEVSPISGQVIRDWATDTDPGIGLGNAATTVVGADGTDIGTGQQNTADIVAQIGNVAASSAAVYCDQYSYGGFSDWFLPSKDELNELYVQRNVVGGITVSYYSTSSEYSNEAFWFQSFIDGYPNTPYKNNAYYIRPVRSFVAPAPSGIITGNLTGNVTGNADTATTLETARTISLSGDVSGSVSFDGSANATISTTVQPNSVALGTDTTGNYMSNLTQGTGVTITHTPGEGSNATIAIGQAVGTSASVTFANLILTGDLTVSGTTTSINTTELTVDDNIIVLNSNVTGAPTENSGLEIERGSSANVSFRWNETLDRWQFTNDGTTYYNLGEDVAAMSVSDTAPSSPVTGQIWYESDTGKTFVYYDSFWIEIIGSTGPVGPEGPVVGLDGLTDVTAPTPSSGDFLKWNGTAWVNDVIDLGTDTTGLYISSLIAGTGITIENNSVESASPTISVDSASVQFRVANVTDTEIGYLDGVTSAVQGQIDLKAPLASPTLTGVPLAPTASAGNNSTQIATTAYADTAVANLVASAPSTLNTLDELAAALGDDANFATTMVTAIGLKAPSASPTFTGVPTAPTAPIGTNTTQIATTAFVAVQASPIGMITAFAGATAPTGWQLCYGQAISRTTYANLFAVLGTTYGHGDSSTTFNLPDLRGRTVAGVDNMGGTDAGRLTTANSLGTAMGAETVTLTTSDIPSHSHTPTVTNNAVTSGNQSADHSHTFTTGIESDNHSHGINDARTFWGENDTLDWTLANGGNISFKRYNTLDQTSDGVSANHTHSGTTAGMNVSHTHSVTSNVSVSNANTGGGGAHNNMQPTMTINYIILAGV